MTDYQKQANHGNSGNNPLTAMLTGLVIGAGIAVVGTVMLRDKKNRQKVKEMLYKVKNQAMGYMERKQKQLQDKKKVLVKKATIGKEKIKKAVNEEKNGRKITQSKNIPIIEKRL
jgi:hypothetical protein